MDSELYQMLESLVIAMESDGQLVDLGRVAGFMQRVSETMRNAEGHDLCCVGLP